MLGARVTHRSTESILEAFFRLEALSGLQIHE